MMRTISHELFIKTFEDRNCPMIYTRGLSTQIEDLRVIVALCRYYKSEKFLELGVRYGHSAKFILEQCPCIEKYIGVDVPFSFVPEKESQKPEIPLQTGIMATFDKRFQSTVLENGTKDLENNNCFGHLFDFIFIDADHSLNGITRDTTVAKRMIKKSGVILWHDYGSEKDVTGFLDNLSREDDGITHVEDTLCCFVKT